MPDLDLAIRGAENHPFIGIADGRFATFEESPARDEIDATGLLALPGVIDAHVHFNEPGRADWEGIATGSRACAAGGTTTFFDMPLNSTPPVIDAAAFAEKRAIAERESMVDFALWGGLVPGNLDRIEELHAAGVIGLKAFMCLTGIQDFPAADTATLRAGMEKAAALEMLVAVHAEIEHPELRHGSAARDYLASRPIEIELEAIRIAIDLAGETGCALHIVHVSSAAGARLVAEADRDRGVRVTCETCPHYLVLTGDDMERLGPVAKCAPPLRSEAERAALIGCVREGLIMNLGSDHSPAPMSMKTDPDFFQVWGGISGCQHLLALAWDLGLDPALLSQLTASTLADRFLLSGKGRIARNADADLVLLDPHSSTVVTPQALHYRHAHTPYLDRRLHSRVVTTLLRGVPVFHDGAFPSGPRGHLLTPPR
jgi:allantoinase